MVAAVQPNVASKSASIEGVMELSFLISRTQFEALESAARTANVSVAQFLRRLVQCSVDTGIGSKDAGAKDHAS